MDETVQVHLSCTKLQTIGATAKGTSPYTAGPSYPCHEDAGQKDRCWTVPVAMAAAAFFLLLPQSCFGLIFVHFMEKFGVNRENASWPQNVAAMTSHMAGILGFVLEQFLSRYHIVQLSAVLSSLALIGSAFSPDMAWMTVTFGLLQGFGYGLYLLASTVYTLPYFDEYQAFANSMKFGAWALAGVIGPFIVSGLVGTYGLNGMLLMFGAFNLQTIPIIMFARNPSPVTFQRLQSHTDGVRRDTQSQEPVTASGSRISLEMMPGFYVFVVTTMAGDYVAVEFGTTIVDYGLDKAITPDKANQLTTFLFSGELAGRVVSLCVAQGIAQGYGLCIKYILVADFLGVERTAASFGMSGVAMVPLSIVSPKILDLKHGYWQIEVDERDRKKTAFIPADWLFEFKVMPFGLCSASATFQRVTDAVLAGLKWQIGGGRTTAYHPQTNGLTECLNETIADMLAIYVDAEHKTWDVIRPFVVFAYNTAVQETTQMTTFRPVEGRP
ncbi:uncharacterized protein LOC142574988 [Dermacentor variabilis]|uniref:uncharacterized protein LOC142574988 n=1 Tax=Dermacentor variabilis TaxID=34621 RepID=UPI003F5B8584